MVLQFDSHLVSNEDHVKINQLVSHFRGSASVVSDIRPPNEGRNAAKNHLVLNCEDGYVLSIKKQYQSLVDISRELFLNDVTELLGVHHYRIAKQVAFPLPDWSGEYIKIEWGKGGRKRRPNFNEVSSGIEGNRSVLDNVENFLKSYAAIFAMNFYFAISDRKVEHFLWDLEDKTVYSIDNELLGGEDYRQDIVAHTNAIKRVLGPTWFDNAQWCGIFKKRFIESSEKVLKNQVRIKELYAKHSLSQDVSIFEARVVIDAEAILSQFLT